MVRITASIEFLFKSETSFSFNPGKKLFHVTKRNRAADIQPTSLDIQTIHYRKHFLCQFFTEAIDSIIKCLHIFLHSLLDFITKLFAKHSLQHVL